MAFDIGDPIPLTFTTRDATGALAAVTTAVLTITLPDGTSVLPPVTMVSTGTYAPTTPYYSTMAGTHRVSWVGSGVNAQSYADVFNVMASDPGGIISLADARAALGTVTASTIKDEDLRNYIAAASAIMENIVGSILKTTRTETFDGGSSQIVLLWAPLISVSSIIESYGAAYRRTLTPQDIFAGTGADAFGYTVELLTGVVTRRAAGIAVPFPTGQRNIQITYIAGRAVTGNLLLATRLVIRQLWLVSGQQGLRPAMGNAGVDTAGVPVGFAVPNAVLELCAPHARPPGLA